MQSLQTKAVSGQTRTSGRPMARKSTSPLHIPGGDEHPSQPHGREHDTWQRPKLYLLPWNRRVAYRFQVGGDRALLVPQRALADGLWLVQGHCSG